MILRPRELAHQLTGAVQVGAGVAGEGHHLFDDGLMARRRGIFSRQRFQKYKLLLPGVQLSLHRQGLDLALLQMSHLMDKQAERVSLVRHLGGIQLDVAKRRPARARGLWAESHLDAARPQIVTREAAFGASLIEAGQQLIE